MQPCSCMLPGLASAADTQGHTLALDLDLSQVITKTMQPTSKQLRCLLQVVLPRNSTNILKVLRFPVHISNVMNKNHSHELRFSIVNAINGNHCKFLGTSARAQPRPSPHMGTDYVPSQNWPAFTYPLWCLSEHFPWLPLSWGLLPCNCSAQMYKINTRRPLSPHSCSEVLYLCGFALSKVSKNTCVESCTSEVCFNIIYKHHDRLNTVITVTMYFIPRKMNANFWESMRGWILLILCLSQCFILLLSWSLGPDKVLLSWSWGLDKLLFSWSLGLDKHFLLLVLAC